MNLRHIAWAMLGLLFAVPAFAAGEYRTVEIESLRITIDSEWSVQAAPGYSPVRFDIMNLGDDRTIEIFGQGSRWWSTGYSGSSQIHQTLRLRPGDRLRLTISMPVFGDNENVAFQIREHGRTLQAFNYSGFQSNKSPAESAALIVADPASPLGPMAAGWTREIPRSAYYGARGATPPRLDFILDPARLPFSWLGYTSVRAVFIGPMEWSQLAAVQKEALLTWTACGGDFMFVDGDLNTLLPDAGIRPAGMAEGDGDVARYYFGRIHFLKSADVNAKGLADTLSTTRALPEDSVRALPANRSPDWFSFPERGFRLPIPGVEGVPVRSYMAILIVFSVLIGPANYVFLWRKRRQVLLVLTAPLISALFIAVLAGYAAIGEGFGIRGRAETFTLLDQTTKRAATRASVSLYAAGMAPWNGLRFPRELAIYPIGVNGRGSHERESLELTELQQFTSGIARARAPSNFEEIGFRTARERLSFNPTGGSIAVVNGLGANVLQLFYRTGGQVYTLGGPLRSGEQAAMHAGGKVDSEALPAKFQSLADRQSDGTYLALLERSPFLETGAPNVEERGSFHLVLGYAGDGK